MNMRFSFEDLDAKISKVKMVRNLDERFSRYFNLKKPHVLLSPPSCPACFPLPHVASMRLLPKFFGTTARHLSRAERVAFPLQMLVFF